MTDRQRHGFVLLLVAGPDRRLGRSCIATQRTRPRPRPQGRRRARLPGRAARRRRPRSPRTRSTARSTSCARASTSSASSEPEIQTAGSNQITVGLPDVHELGAGRAAGRHDRPAVLLRLGGQRADAQRQDRSASQLLTQDPTASRSARAPGGGPGVPGAGGVPLYEAVKLAAKQPPQPVSKTAVAHGAGLLPVRRARQRGVRGRGQGQRHDARAGPALPARRARTRACTDLLPGAAGRGDQGRDGELVTVPQGTVVLQAANPSASDQVKPGSPNAEFFVLKDNVALRGTDITNPQQSTDQAGNARRHLRLQRQRARTRSRTSPAQIAHRGSQRQPRRQHAQPALRGRARQPAHHRPVRSTTSSTPTGSTAATAPRSPAASRSSRPGPRQRSCASARCRSSSS